MVRQLFCSNNEKSMAKKNAYQFLQAQLVCIGESAVVDLGSCQQTLCVVPDGLQEGEIYIK